jgi:hypothetical protein
VTAVVEIICVGAVRYEVTVDIRAIKKEIENN